ncbi:hypothetical protein EKG38_10385 [Shewanella canadensis]|uniref:Uncharacterized protein n=1 Tax=Shewanella canadensis TaxID=271096 RepID=A0A431WUG3_9GAMM|nr:hypothetical protein [Shewanella canadensis]RTR39308.1 hypothetical protein EKG38_10385 [Shewanella canadensis]
MTEQFESNLQIIQQRWPVLASASKFNHSFTSVQTLSLVIIKLSTSTIFNSVVVTVYGICDVSSLLIDGHAQ